MKPYIICHMLSSIDGRIDGAVLDPVIPAGDYEATGAALRGDAWACGRTTMQRHFAEKKVFVPKRHRQAGPHPVHIARRAKSYAISIDTMGKLRWAESDIGGDYLICVVSERAPEEYLTYLRGRGVSYVVAGKSSVDLSRSVSLLRKHFGIKRLLLEGGGNINGAFLEARLVDEISLLLVPGIDGRRDIPTVFDGVNPRITRAARLRFISVARRNNGTLWIRYKVK